MKKVFLLLILLIIPFYASAELSTNLSVRTKMVGNSKTQIESETFVDAKGNVTVPTDKGYATVKYTYGTGNVIVKEEFLDAHGKPVNCVQGYACKENKYRQKQLIETKYYDVNRKLVNGPDGYARQVTEYEGRHHKSTWRYDSKGKPVGTHRITEYVEYLKIKLLFSKIFPLSKNGIVMNLKKGILKTGQL